jgi:hypothetical protein
VAHRCPDLSGHRAARVKFGGGAVQDLRDLQCHRAVGDGAWAGVQEQPERVQGPRFVRFFAGHWPVAVIAAVDAHP